MSTDPGEPATQPRAPRRPYRKIAAVAVLIAGIAVIAATVSSAKKEPAVLQITLPAGIRELRMDVHHEGVLAQQLAEHLEWSYEKAVPPTQEADLELAPGKYLVTLHPLGPAGQDPAPFEIEVRKGEPVYLSIDLRAPGAPAH